MATDQTWGRRCDLGCESWPNKDIYKTCPVCGEKTERWSNLTPLEDAEALSIKSHAEFERYCEKRDALRQQELDKLEASLR